MIISKLSNAQSIYFSESKDVVRGMWAEIIQLFIFLTLHLVKLQLGLVIVIIYPANCFDVILQVFDWVLVNSL